MHRTKPQGFTLIELLIAIAIVGILATFISGNFFNSIKRGRDAKRKSDIKTIQNSLEQYYSICGFSYPTPEADGTFSSIECTSPATSLLPTVPTDPRTTTPYPCDTCDETTYSICATLETESPANFCLTNQQ